MEYEPTLPQPHTLEYFKKTNVSYFWEVVLILGKIFVLKKKNPVVRQELYCVTMIACDNVGPETNITTKSVLALTDLWN